MLEIAADEELRLFRRDIEAVCAASTEYGFSSRAARDS
jgi:hypothetical protein